ncbi:protein takeout-like [Ostrinia furnacalis]|uniref:protein takeout-like n=1 Tax=Ostrinia furnacalis TaxID=93504 RepID=UPI00103F134F|nr:protein takeout-like [Ostrinia furnacalis]
MLSYLGLVSLLVTVINADPVTFLKCKGDDDKCAKESTKAAIPIYTAGIPEFGVETLDPVFFKNIDSSSPTLKLLLDNVTVKGLRNCIAKKAQRDAKNSKLFLRIQCDATLDGHYVMSGRLLVLPIEGNGKVHVDLKKAVIDVNMDISDKQGKDGKNHWTVKSWSHTYDLKDRSTVRFENLFNGNRVLGQAAEGVIAQSGNEIIREVGSPVIKTVVARVVDTIHHFFEAVPTEDLTLD